jgi:excisionase family DNA binding protein
VEKIGYSVEETAEVLDLSPRQVQYLIARGEIESVKSGRRRLIPAEAPRDYLNRLRAEQNGRTSGPSTTWQDTPSGSPSGTPVSNRAPQPPVPAA